ncbi:hypothetical protein HZB93_01255 [Candidatus Falkowbacteria bacterium]|nr:hypothetical protein [Candidatus Falkowbacteria bacterium]
MEQKNSERASAGDIGWLIERMNARETPITAEEVHRFGRHPAGPILPDLCLEARRLSAEYGTGSKWRREQPPVLALSATPQGKPYVGTVVDGQPIVAGEGETYKIGEPEKIDLHESTVCESFRILGFVDGKPVVKIGTKFEGPADPIPVPGTWVFRGEERWAADVLAASLLSDGSLVSAVWSGIAGERDICRDQQLLYLKRRRAYRKFFLMPDGRLVGIHSPDRNEDPRVCYLDDEKLVEPPICGVVDIAESDESLFWVREERAMGRAREVVSYNLFGTDKHSPHDEDEQVRVDLGQNRYRSNITKLEPGLFAYIGETKRDKLECWVVGGKEQPAFDRVSPLFRRDEQWCYWGAVGRHLCLMEMPRQE